MHKYNSYFPDSATPESLTADREAMLREIFGKVGKDVFIEPPLNIDYGCNISVGDGFYSNFKLSLIPYFFFFFFFSPTYLHSLSCLLFDTPSHLLTIAPA